MSLLKPMYEPVAYSPVTEISAAIGASDTTITIDDGALLGDAPNIAVIGASGDIAETISYGGKNGNILSNVQRGLQGLAKVWPVGAPIARNFTALDQSNIQDNIHALNSSKVGSGGDTMTGGLNIKADYPYVKFYNTRINPNICGYIEVATDMIDLTVTDEEGTSYARQLQLRTPNTPGGLRDSVTLFDLVNNIGHYYRIWGEHNLPVESGNWNGSPTFPAYQVYTETAYYLRIGNRVFISGYFTVTKGFDTSYDSSALGIYGLPFTAIPYYNFQGLHIAYSSKTNIRGALIEAGGHSFNITKDVLYLTIGELPLGSVFSFIIAGSYMI